MKIFNTLTRQKDEFKPINEGEVKIYACGPTVYNFIHIGNARPLCVFDVVRRYFEYRGYKVNFVQNFTDIDDNLVIIDSVSKRFSACGARVGCVVTRNKELQQALLKFCQRSIASRSTSIAIGKNSSTLAMRLLTGAIRLSTIVEI